MRSTTLADIAAEASVAISTVSIVLSEGNQFDQIPKVTRERIQAVAHRLKYQPYAGARQLKRGRSGNIALLLSAEPNRSSLPHELLFGISDELQSRDIGLSFVRMSDEAMAETTPRFLRQKEVDGVLVNYNVGMPRRILDLIVHFEIPTVFLNTRTKQATRNSIYFDHYRAAYQLVERMVALGHHRILLLNFTGSFDHYSIRDSMKGYREAMKKLGLVPRVHDQKVPRAGRPQACRNLLTPRAGEPEAPTAIFAPHPSSALPVVQAAEGLNFNIPGQLSLATVGEGDITTLVSPEPAHIILPWREAARVAVRMLLNRIEKKDDQKSSGRLQCEWHEGAGTLGPAPPSTRKLRSR